MVMRDVHAADGPGFLPQVRRKLNGSSMNTLHHRLSETSLVKIHPNPKSLARVRVRIDQIC